jgi:hypothetical protein
MRILCWSDEGREGVLKRGRIAAKERRERKGWEGILNSEF